ncbi:Imm42 family immunity protein [Bradyrhizobium sp. Arg237L]|uniref:Imm42 family immunity protein n=1 Tax=Bradyrhizobium sp. Arg237L TaxID=3003352 RepID=UPI00249F166C|nr:Imm42 family immunity protein [Bradyrhizobium sp. Arg237L]MDI4232146.1 Imm42 family immunity protein [Bradyrhizobium sp. Arg237L]
MASTEFGDRTRFAVSLELDEDSGGQWMFGKFCYWIDGKMIGNYEEGTSLRDTLTALKWIVHDSGKREDCARFEVPPEDVFEAIDSSMYGQAENASSESDGDATARFEISPQIDIFNQWKIYLIDCRSQARLLYKNLSDPNVSEFFLKRAEFDACIQLAWDQLNALYDRALSA